MQVRAKESERLSRWLPYTAIIALSAEDLNQTEDTESSAFNITPIESCELYRAMPCKEQESLLESITASQFETLSKVMSLCGINLQAVSISSDEESGSSNGQFNPYTFTHTDSEIYPETYVDAIQAIIKVCQYILQTKSLDFKDAILELTPFAGLFESCVLALVYKIQKLPIFEYRQVISTTTFRKLVCELNGIRGEIERFHRVDDLQLAIHLCGKFRQCS